MARPPKFDDTTVLDRAMRLFWRRGWAATSIRDLECELDLAAPAIYRRFGNKDGLAAAALDHYVDRVVRHRTARYLPGTGDPVDNVRSFFTSGVRSRRGEPLIGCLLVTAALEGARSSPAAATALRAGFAEIESALGIEVERAAAAGRVRAGATPEQVTAALTAAWHGVMVLARSGHPPTDLRHRVASTVDALLVPAAPGHHRR